MIILLDTAMAHAVSAAGEIKIVLSCLIVEIVVEVCGTRVLGGARVDHGNADPEMWPQDGSNAVITAGAVHQNSVAGPGNNAAAQEPASL